MVGKMRNSAYAFGVLIGDGLERLDVVDVNMLLRAFRCSAVHLARKRRVPRLNLRVDEVAILGKCTAENTRRCLILLDPIRLERPCGNLSYFFLEKSIRTTDAALEPAPVVLA